MGAPGPGGKKRARQANYTATSLRRGKGPGKAAQWQG